jgi:hypothetical protein
MTHCQSAKSSHFEDLMKHSLLVLGIIDDDSATNAKIIPEKEIIFILM